MSAIADWTDYMRAAGNSPNTIRLRTSVVRILAEAAGVDDPCEIPPRDAIRFLGRDMKPWTRRSYWASLAAWCRWCKAVQLPGGSLLDPVPVPPTPDPAARPIEDETIRRLLAAPLRGDAHAYVRLALYEAMRVHEIDFCCE